MKSKVFIFICACVAQALVLPAVQTHRLTLSGYDAVVKGELNNTYLTHLGQLGKAKQLKKWVALEKEKTIWDAVLQDDRLYFSTGGQGSVYVIDIHAEEPKADVYFETDEVLAHALAIGPDGALYVATSPKGSVYRIEEGKRPELYFDPEDQYIWDLEFGEEGELYVATGLPAHVYKVSKDYTYGEKQEPFFSAEGDHITTIALDEDGALWAGVSPRADLFRVERSGDAKAVASGLGKEITAIHIDGESVYFSVYSAANHIAQPAAASKSSNQNGNSSRASKSSNSPIYRVDPDGFISPIAELPGIKVHTFLSDMELGWMIGSESDGKLYAYRNQLDWALIQRAENAGQITKILKGNEGQAWVFSSNPAVVYQYGLSSEESTYKTDIIDAGKVARWGKLRAYITPADSSDSVMWKSRSGNTKKPDSTWSEWQSLRSDTIASPHARYLQLEATFNKPDAELNNLSLFYQYSNIAPIVHNINLFHMGVSVLSATGNNPNFTLKQLIQNNKGGSASNGSRSKQSTKVKLTHTQGHITAGWFASDGNADAMRYQVDIAKEAQAYEWATLETDLELPVYSFSTVGLDEGYYRMRIRADDALSNLPSDKLYGSRISEPFLIDNSAPEVEVESTVSGQSATIEIHAKDAYSIIAQAQYRINGDDTVYLLPNDRLYDANDETFQVELKDLAVGNHSLIIEVSDEMNNLSSKQVNLSITE